MDEARPVLLLLVPADWDVVPAALTELRRCLGEDYGASLLLRMSSVPLRSPMPMYVGYWPRDLQRFAQRDLRPQIAEAFSSLAWMELDEAG
ncbi:hypothetical protein E7T09_20415 [Deinococcus sp. KSM4-11]|uniref:hypothetical protein n=1 Tax=Deinococcus sp. KSM4-11 TaxID=2568654 RepID=UPI0010A53AB1|nr:hypothetical protein [Deinococcus sp. KSM4-11]THF84371.1 hypothetical protein E7T09_20415 [Deinococcus sp. KSM4-11]